MTRRALGRVRSSVFVREDLADAWHAGLTVVGGIAAGWIVLALLAATHLVAAVTR